MAITNTKNSKKGFTLVELVVVIAILAILAAIAIPVVNSIINTSARNGALSNAQTIELAIKECQADIAAKNTEVYDGGTVPATQDPSGANLPNTLPNAATAHANISVAHVAVAKSIPDAFATVTYNGDDYEPYWDTDADKCVWITGATAGATGATGTDLETGATYVGGTLVALAPGGAISATDMIDNL
ncbi:MAG: prepilin-type N-terminal cleavage/methylation domain-containing protein [Acutalibacteraceae bacterium]|nr:prepilin-type N-terminal cleavage/methylation domain-containing protein [Acutalibacteraceae bacterium]